MLWGGLGGCGQVFAGSTLVWARIGKPVMGFGCGRRSRLSRAGLLDGCLKCAVVQCLPSSKAQLWSSPKAPKSPGVGRPFPSLAAPLAQSASRESPRPVGSSSTFQPSITPLAPLNRLTLPIYSATFS